MRDIRGRGRGLSWNRTVWCLVATVRPLRFTLRQTGVTGGFQIGQENDLTFNLKGSPAAVWRMQWADKSRCGKGHSEAPAGMQGGLAVEQVVAGRCQEALTFWICC